MRINVTRSSMPDYEEYCEEIKDIWDTRFLTNNGSKHRELEERLKEYLGISQVTLFTNGHLALETAIGAFGFPIGAEVITTPFTFASTTHAIYRNGLVPVFCDIKPDDFTIDPDRIEDLITDKTCAIVPVHVYGNMCDVEAIESIAEKHGLKVIYDAAHAFGEKYTGVSSAGYGDAVMFSFHATKVFHTIEGGAVCSGNAELTARLNALKNFGQESAESVPFAGTNAKMNEFQAAMGICNLRHLEGEVLKRKSAAEHYRCLLTNVKGLRLTPIQPAVESNFAYFPVVFDEEFGVSRDKVAAVLAENDIMARKYFYPATNNFSCYSHLVHGNTPVSDYVADNVLCLPIYAEITDEDVDQICSIVIGCSK